MELSPKYERAIRASFYEHNMSVPQIAAKTKLSESEIERVISNPDQLSDFAVHHFSKLTRDLHKKAQDLLKSIDNETLTNGTLAAKASMLKSTIETMFKTHDIHKMHMDKHEDFKLARLLAMGRDDARTALMERYRTIGHVLFGGMSPEEMLAQMHILQGEAPAVPDTPSVEAYAGEVGVNGTEPRRDAGSDGGAPDLSLTETTSFYTPTDSVDGGGEDGSGISSIDRARSAEAASGIGAFRGVKEV